LWNASSVISPARSCSLIEMMFLGSRSLCNTCPHRL
jgi:hypothetical protein